MSLPEDRASFLYLTLLQQIDNLQYSVILCNNVARTTL